MQVATLMLLRTLGPLCYTTSSQSSWRPSLRVICGNCLRQGRRNASNPRYACAVVAVGLWPRPVILWDRPASLTATLSKFMGRGSAFGGSMHRKAASYAAVRIAPIPLRRGGRKRPRRLHRPAPGQLSSAEPRPLWPDGRDLFGRWRKSWRMARAQRPRAGLASILQRQVR